MRKLDIARSIHEEAGVSEPEAAVLLDWIIEVFKSTLQNGEPIAIHEFGKFIVHNKLPRKGRNPSTGEAMTISARRVVVFRASTLLKREVNSNHGEPQEAVARRARYEGIPTDGQRLLHG